MSTTPALPSRAELDDTYERVKNWGRWGADDERGALNHLTPELVARAMALPVAGRTVSLANDISTVPSPECPFPAHHHMLASSDARDSNGIPGYEASRDYLGTDVHGLGLTHIDALCHMFIRGEMYNGRSADLVKSTGAMANTIMSLADGITGRGVLLDIPLARGVDHLQPGDLVTLADLESAERAQGVTVGTGDLLVISTGRDARRKASGGRLDVFGGGMPGLHPEVLTFLHEREIALLGTDGISDPMPFLPIDQWPFPIHQIGIVGIGLHLVDNMRLDDISDVCRSRERFDFALTIAPIRIPRGTGCPVNPIAVV